MPDLEKAQLLFKIARKKGNWGASYDRIEHFKRFPNLKQILKELSNIGWVKIKKKKFVGISLNTQYKKEIIEFIEKEMPYLKGLIK